ASLNNPSPAIIRAAIQAGRPGQSEGVVFASDTSADWIAVAMKKRSVIAADVQGRRLVLLPVGILCYVLIFLGVLHALRRLSPRAELEIAVRKREFIAHYQPIVDLKTGRCIGAEALARWRRPDGTIIEPGLFIPLAEQTGLIFPITDQIMRRVTEDMQELLQQDTGCHISINLCAQDAESGRPLAYLENLLRERNIAADRIWLETTERVFIHPDMARNALTRARNYGHAIAVDDFGTGYSSLSVLHSLPLDVLKIDKSFVDAIGSDSASSRVVPHIIDMARELQLAIIAEGIEQESQATYLREHGVACGQGWFFGKPMEPKAFIQYFKENVATREAPQETTVA
ncbi:MAG: EAL domain-containing protein, partial [Terriglobus sp.]